MGRAFLVVFRSMIFYILALFSMGPLKDPVLVQTPAAWAIGLAVTLLLFLGATVRLLWLGANVATTAVDDGTGVVATITPISAVSTKQHAEIFLENLGFTSIMLTGFLLSCVCTITGDDITFAEHVEGNPGLRTVYWVASGIAILAGLWCLLATTVLSLMMGQVNQTDFDQWVGVFRPWLCGVHWMFVLLLMALQVAAYAASAVRNPTILGGGYPITTVIFGGSCVWLVGAVVLMPHSPLQVPPTNHRGETAGWFGVRGYFNFVKGFSTRCENPASQVVYYDAYPPLPPPARARLTPRVKCHPINTCLLHPHHA